MIWPEETRAHPSPASITSSPPPVPAAHVESSGREGKNLLLWVHTGSADVELAQSRHHLESGDGIWIPVHHWRRIRTAPGSVAFPHPVTAGLSSAEPRDVLRFSVLPEWRDRLVAHFSLSVTPKRSFGYSQLALLDLVPLSSTPPGSPPPRVESPWPRMPIAPGAREVAEEIRRNPGLERSIEEWAACTRYSVSTIRRAFQREAGMSFAEWRNQCRLAAACEFLAAGYDVGRVAAFVGFASRNGFARAFRKHHGIAPSDYLALVQAHTPPTVGDAAELSSAQALPHILQETGEPHRWFTQPIPASMTEPHVNEQHVLTWTYRGSGWLRTEAGQHQRRQGDAMWIPAGMAHTAGDLSGSIGLPIGNLMPSEASITEPIITRFPPSWETYLLHRAVTARSRLRPVDFDHRSIMEIFREQFAARRAEALPMPDDPRARSVARRFLQHMRLPAHEVPDPEILTAFHDELGMSFAGWCLAARMQLARELLANGAKPSAVAVQVGYTLLSSFSRAFSRFHGLSPRAYQLSGDTPP